MDAPRKRILLVNNQRIEIKSGVRQCLVCDRMRRRSPGCNLFNVPLTTTQRLIQNRCPECRAAEQTGS